MKWDAAGVWLLHDQTGLLHSNHAGWIATPQPLPAGGQAASSVPLPFTVAPALK